LRAGHGGPKDVTGDLDAAGCAADADRARGQRLGRAGGAFRPKLKSLKSLKSHGAQQDELILLPDKAHTIGDSFANNDLYAWLLVHARIIWGRNLRREEHAGDPRRRDRSRSRGNVRRLTCGTGATPPPILAPAGDLALPLHALVGLADRRPRLLGVPAVLPSPGLGRSFHRSAQRAAATSD